MSVSTHLKCLFRPASFDIFDNGNSFEEYFFKLHFRSLNTRIILDSSLSLTHCIQSISNSEWPKLQIISRIWHIQTIFSANILVHSLLPNSPWFWEYFSPYSHIVMAFAVLIQTVTIRMNGYNLECIYYDKILNNTHCFHLKLV